MSEIRSTLRAWAQSIVGRHFRNAYVYGSLEHADGVSFMPKSSDLDLLLVLSPQVDTALTRLQALVELRERRDDLLATLRARYRKWGVKRATKSILSFTIASDYDVRNGIHEARNSTETYTRQIYRNLTPSHGHDTLCAAGATLEYRFLKDCFEAWNNLAWAQGKRTAFLSVNNVTGHVTDADEWKDIARRAYFIQYLSEHRTDRPADGEGVVKEGETCLRTLLGNATVSGGLDPGMYPYLASQERKRVKHPTECELAIAREAVALETESVVAKILTSRGKRGGPLEFATHELFFALLSAQATSFRAVDRSVELGQLSITSDPAHQQLRIETWGPVVAPKGAEPPPQYAFDTIDTANLKQLAAEWPSTIAEYLRQTIDPRMQDEQFMSRAKVGLARLDVSSSAEPSNPLPPVLGVRPLSFWVTDKFNYGMALGDAASELVDMRAQCLKNVLSTRNNYVVTWPSHLFVEAAVICTNGHVVRLFKTPAHSAMARRINGPLATVGFEYGLTWSDVVALKDGRGAEINWQAAIEKGASKELGLRADQIGSWRIVSVALQSTHLNTAVIVLVYLNMSRDDFERHYKEMVKRRASGGKELGPSFEDNIEFVAIEDAIDIVREESGKSRWHDTALLRLWHARRASGLPL